MAARDLREELAAREVQEVLDHLALLVERAGQGKPEELEPRGSKEIQAETVPQDLRDHQVLQDRKAALEERGRKAELVNRAFLVELVALEVLAPLEIPGGLRVELVLLVLLAAREELVLVEELAERAQLAEREEQDRRVPQEARAGRETLDLRVELAVLVIPGGLQVARAGRVLQENPDLRVWMAKTALMVLLVVRVALDLRAVLVELGALVELETLDLLEALVVRVALDLRAVLVELGALVELETLGLQEVRVVQVALDRSVERLRRFSGITTEYATELRDSNGM